MNPHSIDVHLVNSFTQNGTGGNPAGVILYPPALTSEQKTAIAKQVGFSETAFVYQGDSTDFNVEFFTAEGEVDFCGHATLAVFHTIASLNILTPGIYTQKTKAGILSVEINANHVVMEQALPTVRKAPHASEVAAALGIATDVITGTNLPIEIVSTGLHDILVPVQLGQLDALQPNFDAIAALSQEFNTIGFHVFELGSDTAITAHCRNFAPLYGINEESATGSSSGALGCYLVNHVFPNQTDFVFEQGRAMQCSSLIQVKITTQSQKITHVHVGGQATTIGITTINL